MAVIHLPQHSHSQVAKSITKVVAFPVRVKGEKGYVVALNNYHEGSSFLYVIAKREKSGPRGFGKLLLLSLLWERRSPPRPLCGCDSLGRRALLCVLQPLDRVCPGNSSALIFYFVYTYIRLSHYYQPKIGKGAIIAL